MGKPAVYIRQLKVGPMENFVYLVGDPESREAVMIDPAWDVDHVLKTSANDGMRVSAGLLTHTHFDHSNGVEALIERTAAKIYAHKKEAAYLKSAGERLVRTEEGYCLKVGGLQIEFLHTPGHTPGGQCFLLEKHLFTGDTLFVDACGRCDLEGSSPQEMYRSLKRLADLPDDVIIYPGHHYGDEPTSTIGREKRHNPYYRPGTLQDFLALRLR